MVQFAGPIEFRLGASLLRRSTMVWGLAAVLGLPLLLVLIVGLIIMAVGDEATSIAEILASAWDSMNPDGSLDWQLWLAAALLPVAIVAQFIQRKCYVKLSSLGMEGYVTKWIGMGVMGLSTGHWRVTWDSVRAIKLVKRKRRGKSELDLVRYRLVIETEIGQTTLSPFTWILADGPDHRLTFKELLRIRKLDASELVERAPLIKALRSRGLEFSSEAIDPESAPAGFDLARHPGMVVQLVLLFGAGTYALLDALFLSSYMALEPLPTWPFVLATVAGFLIALAAGRGAPSRERWIVGVLMVAALTLAVHPGLLRLNALTAEPEIVVYRAVGEGQFESTISGLPDLDLRKLDVPEYWSEYPVGTEHEFELIRGDLGIYQLDLRPVFERTRDYYSQKDSD